MARQVDQDNPTFDLFSEEEKPIVAAGGLDWPHPARFPLNNTGAASVRTVVFGDLKQSASPLLVTGYASLDQIIDFSCDACETAEHEVRLLIGNEPYASRREIFTVNRNDYSKALEILQTTCRELGAKEVHGDTDIAKISLVGVGMRSHAGIASQMFAALARERINIQMISTSEIKISVVVAQKYLELGVRALHEAFGLAQETVAE
mgnify:CR=1 FL=1